MSFDIDKARDALNHGASPYAWLAEAFAEIERLRAAVFAEREACALEALSGGCSCPTVDCAHDETGRAIAARIRRRA